MASACEMDGDVQGTLDICNIPSNHSNEKENHWGRTTQRVILQVQH